MKSLSILFILLCINIMIFGQNSSYYLKGKVVDAESKIALPGATITDNKNRGTTTDINGNFKFFINKNEKTIKLKISYIGYTNYLINQTIKNNITDLGVVLLKTNTENIAEVVVKGKIPVAKHEGDTIAFNAASVKVHNNAKGINLLKKLPGFKVKENKIETQGEQIKKVFIDGKPFFEDDPKNALNSLPAEVIKSIELFDDYGEIASFTGYASGQSSKAINIVTKDAYKNKRYGKYTVGIGNHKKYNIEGNTMINKKNYDLLLGLERNNINKSNSDLSDFKSLEAELTSKIMGDLNSQPENFGDKTIKSFGLNFNKEFKNKSELSINFTNASLKNNLYQNRVQNYQDAWYYTINDSTKSHTHINKFSSKYIYQPSEFNKFIISQKNAFVSGNSDSKITNKGSSQENTLKYSLSANSSNTDKFNNNSLFIWLHNFKKAGRSLTALANISYNNKDDSKLINSNLESYLDFEHYTDTVFSNLNQNEFYKLNELSSLVRISYKEPISHLTGINFVVKTNFSNRTSANNVYNFDTNENSFSVFSNSLSNDIKSNYLINRFELGYSSFDINLVFNVGIAYENVKIKNDFDLENHTEKYYHQLLPVLFGKYFFSNNETLIFYAGSKTIVPSLYQFDTKINFSDPLQITTGNTNLKPGIQHVAMTRYTYTLPEKSVFLSAYAFFKYGHNLVSTYNYFAKENTNIHNTNIMAGTKISQYTNISNLMNIMAGIDFSMPIIPIKSNFNSSIKFSYYDIPSIINDQKIYSRNNNYELNLAIVSNISKKIDFTLSNTTEYSEGRNSENNNNTKFLKNNFKIELNSTLYKNWTTQIDCNHVNLTYFGEEESKNYTIVNFSLGKQFFKKKVELKFKAYDILNQNKGLAFKLHETYKETINSNVLEQFYMFSLSYKF